MATYDVGELVQVTGTFTDPNNSDALIDPTAVFFCFVDPSGTSTTYTYGTDAELTKVSTGVYRVNIDVDEAGKWYYRFYSTGTAQASEPSTFWATPNIC